MLALAPPLQHNPSSISHRPTSASASSSRTRPFSTRKPHSSSAVPSTSSTISFLPSTVASSGSGSITPASHLPADPFKRQLDKLSLPILQPPTLHPIEPSQSSSPLPSPFDPSSFDIHSYPPADLLRLLASLLGQIASTNDKLSPKTTTFPHASGSVHFSGASSSQLQSSDLHPPIWHTLTTASRASLSTPTSSLTFHARNVPTISLESYLLRILKYCPTTNEVFLSLLVYFDRMSKLANDATGKTFVIDSYNVHRLVIAGITVASKFFSDVFYTNSRYAKVGGLPQSELNQLELQFLLLNDFRLVISPEEIQRYAEQLVMFSRSNSPNSALDADIEATTPALVQPQSHLARAASPPRSSSGPSAAMGAVDAYGGRIPPSVDDGFRNRTPHVRPSAYASDYRDQERVEAASDAGTETDVETDDEPTIRPTHSSASSETQSLCSTAASEDTDDDDDGDDDDDDDDDERDDPERSPRASLSRGNSDRHMASP